MADFRAATAFEPYLLPGERVLWTGRPKQGLSLRHADAFLIPFSIFWAGFALLWNVAVWTFPSDGNEPDLFFKLFGLPFLLAGIYFVVGRFFHDAAVRRKILYAVTDRRVLVLKVPRNPKLTGWDLQRLDVIEMTEHRDGTGTLAFVRGLPFSRFFSLVGSNWWLPSAEASSELYRIDEPREVYRLIHGRLGRSNV